MSLGDLISAYVDVLARWGPEVAMAGCAALVARDSAAFWWREEN